MRIALILAFTCCALSGAERRPFTLEQVLGTAFPTELVAAPAGGRIAWISNEKGVRNVLVAEPPAFQPRAVTSYKDDDGQELSGLAWSPDGTALAFVRGEGPNSKGENPNPLSKAEGVEQDVFAVLVSGGGPRLMGKGSAPAIAPDNQTVAFASGGQIWTASIDGAKKAAQLLHARGTASELRWSPDGQRLALVSDRGDHAFTAVYHLASKSLQFLDASTDRDSEPAWSPDGTQIAWLREATSQYAFAFGPKREAEPWSIHVADIATGKSREVWRAAAGVGSEFHDLPAFNQVQWGASERLIFPYERRGWVHLYSASLKDGSAIDLTPGDFEVEHFSVTPDRRHVVFASNQADIDRRHLWRVPVGGGAVEPLTKGSDLEWEPAVTTDGRVAFLKATAQIAAHPAMLDGGVVRDLSPMPSDFPAKSLVTPQAVIVSAADGLPIHAQLFLPPNARDGQRHPAVIFFHGGSRRQMLLGWHYMFYYHQAYGFNQYLASRGYIVLSVNYRSGIGYGMEFREAKDYGARGASEYNDVIGAGLYLRGRGDVDPRRIGLWGGSYGGYLTALGLAKASDLFAVGVDLHGVHEWNDEISNFVPAYQPEKRQEEARLALLSSPLAYVSTWRSPVLLIHGDDDRNVNFRQSIILAEALRKQGVHFEELIFPDEIHDFLVYAHWLQAFHAADEFLGRYLKPE